LSGEAKDVVGSIQDFWDNLDTCYDYPEKYIVEALDPVIKFRKYKADKHAAIREFYSLLRAAMTRQKSALAAQAHQ
jgi:hypothetical protein